MAFSQEEINDSCQGIDNQTYYKEILKYLQRKDKKDENYPPEENWIKIHSANYYVNKNSINMANQF